MANEQSEDSRLEQANTLGLEFLRAIILLNGGAILSLLTFIGNASGNAAFQLNLDSVRTSMLAFLIGIVSVLFGLIVSYSYTATAPGYRWRVFWDKHLIKLNALLGLVSLMAFAFGVFSLIIGTEATP
jgi:vacuolar-type H+-ATPase subunit I/STV1